MLNAVTLFFILFVLWTLGSVFVGMTPFFLILGLVASSFIAFVCWRIGIVSSKVSFMVLQWGFYKLILKKIAQKMSLLLKISLQFVNPKYQFKPILDYVFLDKDKDAEIALGVNLITLLPGTLCIALKKRYVIVHSLGKEYFDSGEMYEISQAISKVYDDSLI